MTRQVDAGHFFILFHQKGVYSKKRITFASYIDKKQLTYTLIIINNNNHL